MCICCGAGRRLVLEEEHASLLSVFVHPCGLECRQDKSASLLMLSFLTVGSFDIFSLVNTRLLWSGRKIIKIIIIISLASGRGPELEVVSVLQGFIFPVNN